MIKTLKENPALQKWLVGGISIPMILTGGAWAVDARIEQKTHKQIQQLRTDIGSDFDNKRIDYLLMKKRSKIIEDDEVIELDYLLDQRKLK